VGKLKELRVVVLDEAGRRELSEGQFRGKRFEEIRETNLFRIFEEWSGYKGKLSTLESFKEALLEVQTRALRDDYAQKGIGYVERRSIPVFVWIADDKMAIFAIADLQAPAPKEGAVITHDSRLIKVLTGLFRNYETTQARKQGAP